ncbi:MAG TPA: hypothetical protein VMU04_18510 [Candidatus Acidoferrum sp.]|nr:hypothetical protein [Candidatus Acidoferrum sp.]
MKVLGSAQSGRVGDKIYSNTRWGLVVRSYVPPRNPRTPRQQANRSDFGSVSGQWRALTDDQLNAWRQYLGAMEVPA